jgi:hypothetical protein
MIDLDKIDFDEIVQPPTGGPVTLRTPLRKVPPPEHGDLAPMLFLRDTGREPPSFDANDIRQMLPLVE